MLSVQAPCLHAHHDHEHQHQSRAEREALGHGLRQHAVLDHLHVALEELLVAAEEGLLLDAFRVERLDHLDAREDLHEALRDVAEAALASAPRLPDALAEIGDHAEERRCDQQRHEGQLPGDR